MERLQEVAAQVARGGAIVGGALLLIAALVICLDISLRYLFSLTVGGADDLSGYALAISSAWGFSSFAMTGVSLPWVSMISLTVRTSDAERTKESATMSTSWASPNSRSSRSFSVNAGMERAMAGRLMPLLSPISPPLTTSQRTETPSVLTARISTAPSASKTRSPAELKTETRSPAPKENDVRQPYPSVLVALSRVA